MGFIRMFGLIFFMTILIGGCIVAVNTSPPPESVVHNSNSVAWNEALEFLISGQVASVNQAQALVITLQLHDGTRLITRAPDMDSLQEALIHCGEVCQVLITLNT